jgi:hypothetical protein
MIPNFHTNAFLMPGYATKGMTKKHGSRLVERFVKGDYGMATPSELAANMEAKKNGGELVGRYFLNDERWVLWGTVAAAGAEPDVSPGYILHEKEYRDGWHKWRSEDGPITPAPDHPTKVLFDTSTDPDVTIVAGGSSAPAPSGKLEMQSLQIGYNAEKTHVALITKDRRYVWPVDVVPSIAAGLRACADGDAFPEVSKGMVFAATKDQTLVAVSDTPARARFTNNADGEAVMEIDQTAWSFMQPPHRARDLADGLEKTLRDMAAA